MKLNAWEWLLINNPVRAVVQRRVEGPLLRRIGGRLDNAHVLEIGCGRGVGAETIVKVFGASHVFGVDVDARMIALARQRLGERWGTRVQFAVGDAQALPVNNASFDAVFDFGMLHHVPNWQEALREVRRVLRPGGRFYFEEVPKHVLESRRYAMLEHPNHNRFEADAFVHELDRNGFSVSPLESLLFGDVFVGVARV